MAMKKQIVSILAVFGCAVLFAQSVKVEPYGTTSSGEKIERYTIKNSNGMEVSAITYGATVTDVVVPDSDGNFENVVLNLPDISSYEKNKNFLGPIVGRYGNRLAKSQFKIGDEVYTVDANEGKNSLHGGSKGFYRKVWKAEEIEDRDFAGVKFTLRSPDGDMGYPGNMDVVAIYKLDNDNNFTIEYQVSTDKPTVCNLTWHPYFNLAGAGNGSILTHHLKINANYITPVNEELIPTGNLLAVKDTPFDFTLDSMAIGQRLNVNHPQLALKMGGGAYDHNFVLNKPVDTLGLACKITCPKSGRTLEVYTEEPCLQLYTGQGFDGTLKGANGKYYHKYAGFVIEPQHHPDQPNQKNFFPPTLITPGEVFTSKSVYKFGVEKERKSRKSSFWGISK